MILCRMIEEEEIKAEITTSPFNGVNEEVESSNCEILSTSLEEINVNKSGPSKRSRFQ